MAAQPTTHESNTEDDEASHHCLVVGNVLLL